MNALDADSFDLIIAEDDDDDYLFFSMALEDISHHTHIARAVNGEELMELLLKHTPDFLFIDLHMPFKDGHQCIKEIRADHRYNSMPVIVYSSLTDPHSIDRCFEAGSNLFIMIPGSITELR